MYMALKPIRNHPPGGHPLVVMALILTFRLASGLAMKLLVIFILFSCLFNDEP